jgi:hypothetical protein
VGARARGVSSRREFIKATHVAVQFTNNHGGYSYSYNNKGSLFSYFTRLLSSYNISSVYSVIDDLQEATCCDKTHYKF